MIRELYVRRQKKENSSKPLKDLPGSMGHGRCEQTLQTQQEEAEDEGGDLMGASGI